MCSGWCAGGTRLHYRQEVVVVELLQPGKALGRIELRFAPDRSHVGSRDSVIVLLDRLVHQHRVMPVLELGVGLPILLDRARENPRVECFLQLFDPADRIRVYVADERSDMSQLVGVGDRLSSSSQRLPTS